MIVMVCAGSDGDIGSVFHHLFYHAPDSAPHDALSPERMRKPEADFPVAVLGHRLRDKAANYAVTMAWSKSKACVRITHGRFDIDVFVAGQILVCMIKAVGIRYLCQPSGNGPVIDAGDKICTVCWSESSQSDLIVYSDMQRYKMKVITSAGNRSGCKFF